MTTSLLFKHRVRSFDHWLDGYADLAPLREEFNVTAVSVHRNSDNPLILTVYMQFSNRADANNFVAKIMEQIKIGNKDMFSIIDKLSVLNVIDLSINEELTLKTAAQWKDPTAYAEIQRRNLFRGSTNLTIKGEKCLSTM